MKVTNYMINKWTRAGFLVIIGLILLIYLERLIMELQAGYESMTGTVAGILFEFLRLILYILAFWLLVAAVLNILSGFREPRITLDDVDKKLGDIDRKLPEEEKPVAQVAAPPVTSEASKVAEPVAVPKPVKPAREEIPPPPPETQEKL